MFKIKSATRLAITVGFICTSLLWLALSMNLAPDPAPPRLQYQMSLTRTIAVTVSSFAENNRTIELQKILKRNVEIEKSILSIGLRRERGGQNLIEAGPHAKHWKPMSQADTGSNQIAVNILSNGRKWGQLEILFESESQSWLAWFLQFPNGLILFMSSSLTMMTWYLLNRTFRYLNPSKVVPNRVRSALDSIGSGLVLITPTGEIAHANKAFGQIVKSDVEILLGTQFDAYPFHCSEDGPKELPWVRCLRMQESVTGDVVESRFGTGRTQKLMVNATPIFGSKNQSRGMLVSFEDVTALESKKAELAKIIQTVRMSRDEVERQNEQLTFLASYDPLTKCMNRRSFFPHFERMFSESPSDRLTVFMLDIDHFKLVNDDHGHSTGDEVLKSVGDLLNDVIGKQGIVCRYGGEEFSILLPELTIDESAALAEQVRLRIAAKPIAGLSITASLGLSNKSLGAMDPQHMLDQADQCLYIAKRNGRNQVVRFDQSPTVVEEETQIDPSVAETPILVDNVPYVERSNEIESASVSGLLSALSLRSPKTAEHCVRVANLAVAVGAALMDAHELYNLEISALLHDIGKIGMPDTILNKPGRLTQEEWSIMRDHDEVGLNIVRNSFASDSVAETIKIHHQQILNTQTGTNDPVVESTSSKILLVCDAYDAMVTDQPYRSGMSPEQALSEMLTNMPSQFDPAIVNALIALVTVGDYRKQTQLENSHTTELDELKSIAEGLTSLSASVTPTLLLNESHSSDTHVTEV